MRPNERSLRIDQAEIADVRSPQTRSPMRELDGMLELSASFPTLRGVLDRWDPEALDRWACGPVPGSGAFHAARFVLSVYHAEAPWRCGPFELHRALGAWDAEHRAAFLAWAQRPWWP